MTPRRKRLGVIAGMWDPLDPIETTMTLIAVNISLLLTVSDIWAVVLQNFIPLVLSASREKRGIFLIFPFLQKPMGVVVLKKGGI